MTRWKRSERRDTAAHIVKVAAKLPVADISQNWEIDTFLGGEQTDEHDEFAEGEAAFSFLPRTTDKIAVIAINEEKLANLGGRFRFECLLNSILKKVRTFWLTEYIELAFQ